eukprot:7406080-Pyramimonas_sp.AAC.1
MPNGSGDASSEQRSAQLQGEMPRRGECCTAAPHGRQRHYRHGIHACLSPSSGCSVRLRAGPLRRGVRSPPDKRRDLCRGQRSLGGKGR